MRTVVLWICGIMITSAPWVYAAESQGEDVDLFIGKLEKTLEEDPQNAEARYNLGTVFYHQGRYSRADEALSQVLSGAGDALRQRAAYNLGNTRYRQGRVQERQDPEAAMNRYRSALKGYRLTIRQNPADRDAQFNYELTQKRLESLKQQQNQQKDQQQQQKKQDQKKEQERQQGAGDNQDRAKDSQELSSSEPESQQSGSERDDQQDSGDPGDDSQAQDSGQGPKSDQESAGDPGEASSGTADPTGVSSEQAKWILDNFERKEQQARAQQQKKRDQREGYSVNDW